MRQTNDIFSNTIYIQDPKAFLLQLTCSGPLKPVLVLSAQPDNPIKDRRVLMFKMWQCENFQFLSLSWPMEMGLFWVPKCAVGHKMEQFSTVSLQIWSVHMIFRYLHRQNMRHIFRDMAGMSYIMMSKMWQCANFQFLSENPMGMGKFWVPVSAVGHKWSNFQPFGFNIGLCS